MIFPDPLTAEQKNYGLPKLLSQDVMFPEIRFCVEKCSYANRATFHHLEGQEDCVCVCVWGGMNEPPGLSLSVSKMKVNFFDNRI